MLKQISKFIYFLILILATNYYQLGAIAEQQPCKSEGGKIPCPTFTANDSTKNED